MGWCDGLVTLWANEALLQLMAAFVMNQQRWCPMGPGEMEITPLHEGNESCRQIASLSGKAIFVAGGPLLVGHLLQDPVIAESHEAFGKQIPGDAKILRPRIESPDTPKCVAQDQQAPTVADHAKSGGNGAIELEFCPRR